MKKILALILAFCMCLAVLVACKDSDVVDEDTGTKKPASSQSDATPEDTDPEETDPEDTDPEEEDTGSGDEGGEGETPDEKTIEIGSVAEWEALAKDGDPDKEDFLNKTVKLTANIDFGNETASTLFKTFAGTFDGGNFTVKGKTVSRMSLIANTLDGATVKNLTVDGFAISCPVEGAENTSVIAANAMTKDVTFENITVKNCSIDADKVTAGNNKGVGFVLGEAKNVNVTAKNITVTACEVTAANKNSSKIGGVVGYMLSSGLSKFEGIKVDMNTNAHGFTGGIVGKSDGIGNLNFSKIKVTGTFNSPGSTGGSETMGGIFGAKNNEAAAAGESFVKNAFVDVKLYCTSNSGRAGAIGGYWYKGQNSSANITIENCYLKGEWSVRKGETMRNRSGGIFGEYGAKNSTLTLKNVILEAAVDQTWSGSDVTPDVTKLGGNNAALIINYENTKVDNVLSHVIAATDCYTTIVSKNDGTALELPAGFTGVTSDKTAAMVTYDASGYVTAINAPAAS